MRLHRLIDLAKNKYDEDVTPSLVDVATGDAVKRTRLDDWVLRSKVADTPAENAEEVLNEQSEAGFGERNEMPLSGVDCAP